MQGKWKWFLGILGVALALHLALMGCAASSREVRYPDRDYEPGPGEVPPSFYDYDPTLRHWFTLPYYNPYIQR